MRGMPPLARCAALGLVLGLLLAGCARPGGGANPGAGTIPTPERTVLPNGVVVIAQEHRASDVVALQLWLRTGGRDEAPDELGLSHYLEHMLFKGTPTRPPGAIDALIEGLGGRSNAYTSHDYTHYDLILPAAHARTGVELLADIAVNADFDPEELERERKVVFEEMRQTEDDPDRFLLRRLYELAYAGHPYGRPILGRRADIEALTRAELRRYYEKFYVPRHMVLVVVGPVAPGEVRRLAAATFGQLPDVPAARPPVPPLPPLDRRSRVEVVRPEEHAALGLAWRVAPTNHPDVYAVDLLTYILGDGPSSRLNQAVRERERLVFAIQSGYGAWEKAGLMTVTARLDAANLERAEAAILDVVRRVRAEGVTEAERERALVTAEANYAFDIETAEGLAKTYGQGETTWTLADEVRYLARLRQTSAAEIQAAARKYLGDDSYARVRFVPREARR
jgi:zinc protease